MNSNGPLVPLLSILVLISCNDDETKQNPRETTCRINQFIEIVGQTQDTNKFEYDGDGNLIQYTLIEDGENFSYNLSYNQENELEEIRNNKDGDRFQFFYSGKNISQMVSSYNFNAKASNVTEFTYGTNGKISQVEEYAFDELNEEKYLFERVEYIWEGNNLSSYTSFLGDSLEEKTTFTFSNFDAQNNPLHNLPIWYLEYDNPQFFCQNNFRSVSVLADQNTRQLDFKISYDSENRVSKIEFLDFDDEANQWTFDYQSCR